MADDGRGIGIREREVVPHGPRAIDEQRHGLLAGERGRVGTPVRIRRGQRGDLVAVLGGELQQGPAGDQDAQAAGRRRRARRRRAPRAARARSCPAAAASGGGPDSWVTVCAVGSAPVSLRPSVAATMAATRSGSTREARGTKTMPSGKASASSPATRSASLVLPIPPGPVRVSRWTSSRRRSAVTAAISRCRPTNEVACVGRPGRDSPPAAGWAGSPPGPQSRAACSASRSPVVQTQHRGQAIDGYRRRQALIPFQLADIVGAVAAPLSQLLLREAGQTAVPAQQPAPAGSGFRVGPFRPCRVRRSVAVPIGRRRYRGAHGLPVPARSVAAPRRAAHPLRAARARAHGTTDSPRRPVRFCPGRLSEFVRGGRVPPRAY